MLKILALCLLLVGCEKPHRGGIEEKCNPDGSCNGPNLECNEYSSTCHAKSPPQPPRRCYYESECFCVTCAERCSATGVSKCLYSDTSVWGSKPAICECK